MAERMSLAYRASLKRLSGEQKLSAAFALYWEARKLKAARLRAEHPRWTELEIEEETKRIFMHALS